MKVALSFSGDLSGSHLAASTPVLGGDGQPEFGSWAIAADADSLGVLVPAAFRPSEDPKQEVHAPRQLLLS